MVCQAQSCAREDSRNGSMIRDREYHERIIGGDELLSMFADANSGCRPW
jgi:hypothetical protein